MLLYNSITSSCFPLLYTSFFKQLTTLAIKISLASFCFRSRFTLCQPWSMSTTFPTTFVSDPASGHHYIVTVYTYTYSHTHCVYLSRRQFLYLWLATLISRYHISPERWRDDSSFSCRVFTGELSLLMVYLELVTRPRDLPPGYLSVNHQVSSVIPACVMLSKQI